MNPVVLRRRNKSLSISLLAFLFAFGTALLAAESPEPPRLEAGLARVDITPELPIRLAGYAHRKKPAEKIDLPLVSTALALRNPGGGRFVLVSVDNCEVGGALVEPVIAELSTKHGLERGAIAIVSSHTHSAPVLAQTLVGMPPASGEDEVRIQAYSRQLREKIKQVVGEALGRFEPAVLEYGVGRAEFAMNRRVYRGDKVVFGDNPEGPVDWDVPVLRIKGTNGAVRAVLFGYACHGTSIRDGDDFYTVTPEYMGYACQHLEAVNPGAMAMFVPGMGADSDPSPRGRLVDAKRHGLELAGAVVHVLDKPMRPVKGSFGLKFEEIDLPLADPPPREQIEKDATSADGGVKQRALVYLKRLEQGTTPEKSVKLPVAVARIGNDLTFVLMGGEVVVDYSKRLKRVLGTENPWVIGYAYDVPCYIPSFRIIREGGYEAESSLAYYGLYGPFRTEIEEKIVTRVQEMARELHR